MLVVCKPHKAEMVLDEEADMWTCPEPGCRSAIDGGAVARHEALRPDDEAIEVVPEGSIRGRQV